MRNSSIAVMKIHDFTDVTDCSGGRGKRIIRGSLSGKSQASSATSLTTTLAGRVVAVLPGGNLVVEAERIINMNHEKQTIVLRGIVRRGDIGPNNTVASNTIGDLELEIKGKGVISDGVRPPHPVLRAILRVLNF